MPRENGTKRERPKIRKVRTEHGTRVQRSITCFKCGAKDHVHFVPKEPDKVLCRRCAADKLGVLDPDTQVASERLVACSECGKNVRTRMLPERDAEFVCPDCRRGIETNRTHRAKQSQRLSNKVIRVRSKE